MSSEGGPYRVGYQGEPGAWGEYAILARFPVDAVAVPCPSFAEVGRRLVGGQIDLAVLPTENTAIGPIPAALAVISKHRLRTVGEITVPVRHCLLALPGARLETLRTVSSHPAALAQCRRFLRAHAWVRACRAHDTAGAARRVARACDTAAAAIAARAAAARYGLHVLAQDIQDDADNCTLFRIIAAPASAPCNGALDSPEFAPYLLQS